MHEVYAQGVCTRTDLLVTSLQVSALYVDRKRFLEAESETQKRIRDNHARYAKKAQQHLLELGEQVIASNLRPIFLFSLTKLEGVWICLYHKRKGTFKCLTMRVYPYVWGFERFH